MATVSVAEFDNPEVMEVPLPGGQTLFFCTGVAIVFYTGSGNNWRRDDLVFLVPSEQAGELVNPPPLALRNFSDSVVTVVPATVQNDDPGTLEGWGIDHADSMILGDNIQVTARIVAKGDLSTVLRVAYHAVILG